MIWGPLTSNVTWDTCSSVFLFQGSISICLQGSMEIWSCVRTHQCPAMMTKAVWTWWWRYSLKKHCSSICLRVVYCSKHVSHLNRFTSKVLILNFLRVGRWVSTWRASRSTTLSTLEDPAVFSFTKAKVSCTAWHFDMIEERLCSLTWCCTFPSTFQVFVPFSQIKSPQLWPRRPNRWGWLLEGQVRKTSSMFFTVKLFTWHILSHDQYC